MRIGARIGHRFPGGYGKKGLPAVLVVEIGKEGIDLFKEITELAENLEKKKLIEFGVSDFLEESGLGHKTIDMDFGQLDTIRPILNKLRGHDLNKNYNGSDNTKTTLMRLTEKAKIQINVDSKFLK